MDDEFRHRTHDLWEASFLWSEGYSPTHVEIEGDDRVVFIWPVFPLGQIEEAVRAYRSGTAQTNARSMRQGYYVVRSMMRAGLRDAVAP